MHKIDTEGVCKRVKIEDCRSRIKKAMSLRGMSQSEIVEKTNIKKSALSQYLSGRISPRQNVLIELSKVLRVNEVWLMGYDVPYLDQKIKPGKSEKEINVKHMAVPMFSKTFNGSIDLTEAVDTFNLPSHIYKEDVYTVVAQGDAMMCYDGSDFIANNTIVVIDPVEISNLYLVNNKVCLLTFEGETQIKQLKIDTEGNVRLHAFNPNYKDIKVDDLDKLKYEGRVISSFLIKEWK